MIWVAYFGLLLGDISVVWVFYQRFFSGILTKLNERVEIGLRWRVCQWFSSWKELFRLTFVIFIKNYIFSLCWWKIGMIIGGKVLFIGEHGWDSLTEEMNRNGVDGTRTMMKRKMEVRWFSKLTLSDPDNALFKFADMMLRLMLKTSSTFMTIGFIRTDNFIKHLL